METLKIASFIFCGAYTGIMGIMWNQKDTLNQIIKAITIASFIFSAILAVSWIRNGIWFSWFFAIPVVLAGSVGLLFTFANGTGISAFMIRLLCLCSTVSALIYFQS